MYSINSVTIIIATWNAVETIESCLISCLNQTFIEKKIIIIDGNSNDGTQKIIEKYRNSLFYYISENDNGIYDAWNKALKIVNTRWVTFIGADDEWASIDSLDKLVSLSNNGNFNFVSSKLIKVDSFKNKVSGEIGTIFSVDKLYLSMNIAHPGSLHCMSIFDDIGYFDDSYKIVGDYDFFCRARFIIRPIFLNDITINMFDGGMSMKYPWVVLLEGTKVVYKNYNFGIFLSLIFLLVRLFSILKVIFMSFFIKKSST
jgi:glycosyltransferase involved in cell wall biosynthesis